MLSWLSDFFRDLRYAFRSLRLNPGILWVALVSLALGIGGATAVLGLLDTVVFRPLPVSEPGRLVTPTLVVRQGVFDNFSYTQLTAFRAAPALAAVSGWSRNTFDVRWEGHTESLAGQSVTPEYFETLGITAALGRFSTTAGSVVISYRLWETRFHRSTAAIGQLLEIQGRPFPIAAVAPRGFFGTEVGSWPDVFVPLAPQPADAPRLKIIGRLVPNARPEQAAAQLNAILHRQLIQIVDAAPANTPDEMKREFLRQRIDLVRGGAFSPVRRQFAGPLLILMALVAMVMLIACGNVANLLLCRALNRRREIAIRLACGAPRGRILRQLLAESLLLSGLGGCAGALLAEWLRRLLVSMFDTGRPAITLATGMDFRTLGATAFIAVLTGLLMGLAPATAIDADLSAACRGQRPFLIGKALVVLQVALSTCLLMGAGLFVRTLANLRNVDMGFQSARVMVMRLHPEQAGIPREQVSGLYRQLLDAVRRIPGMQSASLSRFTPMEGSDLSDPIRVEGETVRVNINYVDPQYFATMGTPLLMGRDFQPADATRRVAIVNQALVKRYFANTNPIGRHFQLAGPSGAVYEIVGVARDMKYRDLRMPAPLTVFYSALQDPASLSAPQLSVRVADGMKSYPEALRRVVAGFGVPAGETGTLDQQIEATLVQERALAHLSSALGLLALALTCVGLYGIISYTTARRTNEIGIRMALGASAPAVVWRVVRETLVLVGAGVLGGLPAALWAVRLIRVGLFGVSALDPVTMIFSGGAMLAAAVIAGYLPARRASLVNPAIALRADQEVMRWDGFSTM